MAKVFDIRNGNNWAYKQGAVLGSKQNTNSKFGAIEGTFARSSSAYRVNSSGLIEEVLTDVPLIDYLDDANGLLKQEPQSTNEVTYSEDFSDASWTKARVTEVVGALDIYGTNLAYTISNTVDNNTHGLIGSTVSGLSASTNHAISVFVSYTNNPKVMLRDATLGAYLSVDLSTNTVLDSSSVVSSKIETINSNYVRISMVVLSSGGGQLRPSLYLLEDSYTTGGITSYVGDVSKNVIVTGFQLEEQDYATSYIKTEGSAVTRNASTLSGFGNEFILPSSEGVLFADIKALTDDLTNRAISISDGTLNNSVYLEYYNVSNRIRCRVYSGGGLQATRQITGITITELQKVALVWGSGTLTVYLNGSEFSSTAIASSPVNLNRVNADLGQGSSDYYGDIKQLQVYDQASDISLINWS